MKVTYVSRGKIELEDGPDRFAAYGEALLPEDRSRLGYIVYLNSLKAVGGGNNRITLTGRRQCEIIECIKAHFAAQSTAVEFE